MASTTAMHHPQVMSSQSPDARKIVWLVCARPDWFSAVTAIATTPSPKAISVNVPRYSDRNSPHTVLRQAAPAPIRTCQTPLIPLASVVVSATSTSLFDNLAPLERGGCRLGSGGYVVAAAPALQRPLQGGAKAVG